MKRGKIKKGWVDAGCEFDILGNAIEVNGTLWTPVLHDTDEDPTFQKTNSIEVIKDDKDEGLLVASFIQPVLNKKT